MNKLKVLFITHYANFYGANISMLNLIIDLINRHNCEVIVLYNGEGNLHNELMKQGIKSYNVNYNFEWENSRTLSFWEYNKEKLMNRLVYYPIIKRLLKQIKPDIIHSNSSVVDIGEMLSLYSGIPHIWHVREFGDTDYGLQYLPSMKQVRKKYESCNRIIAISAAIEQHYRKIAPNANIVRIYNGISDAYKRDIDVSNSNSDLRYKKTDITFCCVGKLSEQKNQMELLKAANNLWQQGKKDFFIKIIGEGDAGYEEKLKKYISESNLSSNVLLMGYRTDITEILRTCDVGIMCSLNEAFGRTTVEYMFAGMPVIGTNTGGTPEIILDGETGFHYQSGDYNKLSKLMGYFIENQEVIYSMGKNGQQRAIQNFSMQENTDAVYRLYLEVIEGK